MYNKHLEFVRDYLEKNQGDKSDIPHQQFRSRYNHILRVLKWADRISDGLEIDMEVLKLSIVFHDAGYGVGDNKNHAIRSRDIFIEYAKKEKLSENLITKVAYLIENHSKKHLLGTDIPIELTVLMEADQMDEEGSMRILWDCFVLGGKGITSYEEAYNHIERYKDAMPDKMVTENSKKIWKKKQDLYKEFLLQLKEDLFI